MNKDNPYIKNIPGACTVCGKIAYSDQFGNGICKNCGWHNQDSKFTVCANYPNMVSLEEAKELNRQGKKLLPTFAGFLDIVSRGFEMALWYRGKKYGVMKYQGKYDFYLWGSEENFQEYMTIEELREKANIDGKLLKDIWDKIKRIEYDC